MSSSVRSVIIHGHFYQPPREDPWTGELESEPSAAPFHDWNARIDDECYRRLVATPVFRPDGSIGGMLNTLTRLSFNFGSTLLAWMEQHAPDTFRAILDADAQSCTRLQGHGNALAQPYHHAIMPLTSRREKVTEIRWGIADFRARFGRDPEGMWLPETAVDHDTLDVMAAEGIKFTIVAPHQIEPVPPNGMPGLYRAAGGRSISLFAYNGALSHDIAFGGLLGDPGVWAERLAARGKSVPRQGPQLIAVATDGETYGHHHRMGAEAVAATIRLLERRDGVEIVNFADFLSRHPPRHTVNLVSPSSWSCAHGVDRWRADCGCKADAQSKTSQAWRAPLRDALDQLAGEVHDLYAREATPLFGQDPWAVRDQYGTVLNGGSEQRAAFVQLHMTRLLSSEEQVRARELLELERNCLRMFTSCGWFFDDLCGLETDLILRAAARAIELAGPEAERLEAELLERLGAASGNPPLCNTTGRDRFLEYVKPQLDPAVRSAGGLALIDHLRQDHRDGAADSPGFYTGTREKNRITVTHAYTGRTSKFRVTIEQERPGRVCVTLQSLDRRKVVVRLRPHDLYEHHREIVLRMLRHTLTSRSLGAADVATLAAGESDFRSVVRHAIIRAVRALASDESQATIDRVADLCDLLALEEETVPELAQVAFYRIWQNASPPRAVELEPAATLLGFAIPRSAP